MKKNLSPQFKASLGEKISHLLGYLVFIFIIALLFVFFVWPIGVIVSKAFWSGDGFTLDFFRALFQNNLQTSALLNSAGIGVMVTFFSLLVSLPFSFLNTRGEFPGKVFFFSLLLVPMVMPPFVGAIGIQRFFAKFGSVNSLLLKYELIKEPIEWLGDNNMFWAVVILEVFHLYPIMYLNLSAALANVDPSLEEAAAIQGAGLFRRIRNIVWPLARPGFFAGAMIVFIWAFTDLGTPLLVGYHDVVPVRIFNLVTDINENPMGYALVFIVILLTVVFFLLSKTTMSSKKYQMLARGHVSSRVTKYSFRQAWWIYLLTSLVVGFALIPHLGVVLTSISDQWFMSFFPESYTMHHYQEVFYQELSQVGIKNSLFLASLSTLFDCVLGVAISYVIVRKLIPFGALLDAIVMVPLALPGIVLAFGYVITFSDTFLDPLMNPVPLLIIAYGIRRLPYMVRAATAGLQQTSAGLEEVSFTLGASKLHTVRKITIPLVLANLIAGGLLCFSYAMLDVSDSLILAMKDKFYPLTKAIYSLYLEQGTGEYVASALGVIAMLILTLCIMGASKVLGKKMGELFRV